jgi:hypothetical protein
MIEPLLSKALIYAAAVGDPCALSKKSFFFIPPWWEYLSGRVDPLGACAPTFTNAAGNFQLNNIWLVGLAILDMLLRIVGFVAVISIMVSGLQYIMAGGSPEKAVSARKRAYNALYGLAIAFIATAAVTFIGNQLAP